MTINVAGTRPDPGVVGRRAAVILEAVRADEDFDRLAASAGSQAGWSTFVGFPIVAGFVLSTDTGPLLAEALKVLALKAAVFELSGGDERAAALVVPVAVDEMVHAVLVQQPLVVQLQHRLGIVFVHMTDRERFGVGFGWEPGDYTEDCYRAAGWGDPPARYWVSAAEAMRRLGILDRLYHSIGVLDCASSIEVDFGTPSDADAVQEHPKFSLWEDPASEGRFTAALRRWRSR